jgi:hypothetical protein
VRADGDDRLGRAGREQRAVEQGERADAQSWFVDATQSAPGASGEHNCRESSHAVIVDHEGPTGMATTVMRGLSVFAHRGKRLPAEFELSTGRAAEETTGTR